MRGSILGGSEAMPALSATERSTIRIFLSSRLHGQLPGHFRRISPSRQPDDRLCTGRNKRGEQSRPTAVGRNALLCVLQMGDFLFLYRENERMQTLVAIAQKAELILKMSMHRGLDGGRANPNSLPAQQRRYETEHKPAVAPQRHDAARTRASLRHRFPKQRAVPDLARKGLLQEGDHVGIDAPGNQCLATVDAYGPVLAGMIDLEDSGDGKLFSRVHRILV